MMKWRFCVPILALGVLSGCIVQSINPYFTDDMRIKLPEIQGKWQMVDKDSKDNPKVKPWEFGEEKIMTWDEEQASSPIEAAYFKVGGTYYMDGIAGDVENAVSNYWKMTIIPVHVLMKVELSGDKLVLTPLDLNQIVKLTESGTKILKAVKGIGKDSNMIFVSEPSEWVEFLKTNENNKDIFLSDGAIHFRKIKE